MPGGKGKSSGGKSSGGKVGADGSKKQQSHSSKAGLQVSLYLHSANLSFLNFIRRAHLLDNLSRLVYPTKSRHILSLGSVICPYGSIHPVLVIATEE